MTANIDVSRWPAPLEGENHEQLKIMLAGEPYIAVDPYLMRIRDEMANKMYDYNAERNSDKRAKMLESMATLRPKEGVPQNVFILPPFTFEYGFNLNFGTDIYVAPNGMFIDVNEVWIGDRTMLGANVQIYTPSHPLSPEARAGLKGPEWAKRIKIGDDCWIGGGVIIVPGVTIGNGVTIGAGSVVTKDIPDRCVAVGNPAKVIKRIKEDGTTETVARA